MEEALYFREHFRPLFGVYHSPEKETDEKEIGVIICHPFGQEYVRSHRAIRKLSENLTLNGFHNIRFDLSGCGDSFGDINETTVDDWIKDIGFIVNELKLGTGVSKIYLVGLRLGGSLSVLSLKELHIDGLVLWNPVLDGSFYLSEITNQYKKWLTNSFVKSVAKVGNGIEVFGYFIPKKLLSQFYEIKIRLNEIDVNGNLLYIDSKKKQEKFCWYNSSFEGDNTITCYISEGDDFWMKSTDKRSKGLVPLKDIENITHWLISENWKSKSSMDY